MNAIASGVRWSLSPGAQSLFFQAEPAGTLVFDEIDVGVSGVAQAIAEKCTNSVNATKFFVSPTNRSSQQWQTATSSG